MTPKLKDKPAGKVKLLKELAVVRPIFWGLLFLATWQTFMVWLLDADALGMALSTGAGMYFTFQLIGILQMVRESSK